MDGMSSPRAATSVAMSIEPGSVGDEKRSMERRRAFCGICEWSACAGTERVWRREVKRRTEGMELVKTKVRVEGLWRRSA